MSRLAFTAGAAGVVLVGGLIAYAIYEEVTEPLEGTVTELEYTAEQWWTSVQCTPVGKTTTCSTTQHHTPECYGVTYRAPDGEVGDDCTDPATYAGLEVGDHYAQGGAS